MFTKSASRGEWWEVGGNLTDPTTKQPRDVTDCTVTITVRAGAKATDPLVTVDGATGQVLDGPTGSVMVGGRIATPGSYYATIDVVDVPGSPGAGWPVRELFKLKIEDCP
jgi:hypothetical protein